MSALINKRIQPIEIFLGCSRTDIITIILKVRKGELLNNVTNKELDQFDWTFCALEAKAVGAELDKCFLILCSILRTRIGQKTDISSI